MGIHFHTENLNKNLYRQMIFSILAYNHKNAYDFITFWDVHIWPLQSMDPKYLDGYKSTEGNKVNFKMAWGITGKNRIDLYLNDTNNTFIARENSTVLQHEICHALLFGTPHFVDGVHDNQKNIYPIEFWYWSKWRYRKFRLWCIDIRDLL
jgi:hypothetical protein